MSINPLGKIDSFLVQISKEVEAIGIDTKNLQIDHIAFSAKTSDEYERVLADLLKQAILIREVLISNRRVAVVKLNQHIVYDSQKINVVEVIEPKVGEVGLSSWEHVEYLVPNYQSMLEKYPDLDWDKKHMQREHFSRLKLTLPSRCEVKFLITPILESVKNENL